VVADEVGRVAAPTVLSAADLAVDAQVEAPVVAKVGCPTIGSSSRFSWLMHPCGSAFFTRSLTPS
jgi:hypothetical protein